MRHSLSRYSWITISSCFQHCPLNLLPKITKGHTGSETRSTLFNLLKMGFYDHTNACKYDIEDPEEILSAEYTRQTEAMQSALIERLDELESRLNERFDELEARLTHIEVRLEDTEDELRARK